MSGRRHRRRQRRAYRQGPVQWNEMYRVPQRGMIFGVCYGVAHYMGWNARLFRLAVFIAFLMFSWPVLLLYLAAAYVLPARRLPGRGRTPERADEDPPAADPVPRPGRARDRFRAIDTRLAKVEAYLHSEEYGLRQQFRELEA